MTVGLFDINVLETNRYWASEAILIRTFNEEKLEFKEINTGNYVVALTSSNRSFSKTVQIKAGKSITIDLFD